MLSFALCFLLGSCNSFLAASFRSNASRREFNDPKSLSSSFLSQPESNDALHSLLPIDDSPNSVKGFGESQLEIFNYKHGILILHLLATLMFIPSLGAWIQVCNGAFCHGFLLVEHLKLKSILVAEKIFILSCPTECWPVKEKHKINFSVVVIRMLDDLLYT